jgi:hypothetical protein
MPIKFGSKVTALGARGAEFKRRAKNCRRRCSIRRTEFAQGAHRLRTVAGSQLPGLVLNLRGCTPDHGGLGSRMNDRRLLVSGEIAELAQLHGCVVGRVLL